MRVPVENCSNKVVVSESLETLFKFGSTDPCRLILVVISDYESNGAICKYPSCWHFWSV